MSESGIATVPEDAFYSNPFGIDESAAVELDDMGHDMFCSFLLVRYRMDIVLDSGQTNFGIVWCPHQMGQSINSWGLTVSTDWVTPDYADTVCANYSHFRVVGAGMRFIPTMSSDSATGTLVANMFCSTYPAGGADVTNQNTEQWTFGDYPNDALTVASKARDRRGYVEGSASSGLQCNWRKLKYMQFSTASCTNAVTTAQTNYCYLIPFNYEPDQFYPTELNVSLPLKTATATPANVDVSYFMPRLLFAGTGLPTAATVGTMEFVLGICGAARSKSVMSKTPMPVFLGCSLTRDLMSNQKEEREAKVAVLRARAEAKGARLWKALDIASTVARSLAPIGMAVNPAIGGALMGASTIGSSLATTMRSFTSG